MCLTDYGRHVADARREEGTRERLFAKKFALKTKATGARTPFPEKTIDNFLVGNHHCQLKDDPDEV